MGIPSFPTINNPMIQAALAEATEQEPGTILNDHYSADFYCERRARFLGRHPDYAHVRNGIFEIACDDADAVFGDYQDDLSVQEVRRREINNEIVPFLPFPTTCNTETIDNFSGLPDSEWAAGKRGVSPLPSPTPTPPPTPAAFTAADGAEVSAAAGEAAAITTEMDQPESEDQRARSLGARSGSGTGAVVRPAPAYVNAPTNVPIKHRRGTKRPPTGPNETVLAVDTDSEDGSDFLSSGDDAPEPPPRKKLKLKLNAGRRPTPQAPPDEESKADPEVEDAAPRKSSAPKKKTKASGAVKSSQNIDAIVSGAALPRSAAQARAADDVRCALLLKRHADMLQARKKKAPVEPDMMPEYFYVSNFPQGQEQDQVRCVCGAVRDDGGSMVCCDAVGCSVWQHVACVGEAAPADLENGRFRCHNCDPYAHRRVIQQLRRANVVEG